MLTFVDRLERGFTTTIEASSELDLWNTTRSKVANVSDGIYGSVICVGAVIGLHAVSGLVVTAVHVIVRTAIPHVFIVVFEVSVLHFVSIAHISVVRIASVVRVGSVVLVISVMLMTPVMLVVTVLLVISVVGVGSVILVVSVYHRLVTVAVGGIIGSVLHVSGDETNLIVENKDFGKISGHSRDIINNTNTVGAKGECVMLRSTSDGNPRSWIEEQVGIIRRVLSLNKTVKLAVPWRLLTVDRIPKCRWAGAPVRRGVLLSLAVLHGRSNHFGLSCHVELTRSICDNASDLHVGHEERGERAPMILSAMSCCEHSVWATNNGAT